MAFLRRARAPIAGALVLLAALAAWWYFSPYLALRELRAAAQARDVATIEAHVDFPKLRESLKTQLGAAMTASLRSTPDNPFAALGASIGTTMVNGVVEILVRPEMLMYSLRSGLILGTQRTQGPPGPSAETGAVPERGASATQEDSRQPRWRMERQGPDRVVFHPDEEGSRKTAGMVFDRHGFATWKLTAMQLPLTDPQRRQPAH